jgi:hypothetical protein
VAVFRLDKKIRETRVRVEFLVKVKKPGQRKIFSFYVRCMERTTELFKALCHNDFRGCFEDCKAFMD